MRTIVSLLVAVTLVAETPGRFNYIYKRGNDSTICINGSIEDFERLAKRFTGEYVWLEQGKAEYLIRNAAVLAQVRQAFAEMDAFEPTVQAAEKRLRPIEEKAEELERRIDEIEDSEKPGLEAELREAEKRLEAMEGQLHEAELAVERLEKEMDRREEIAEKKFEEIVLRAVREGKAERVR